MTRSMLPLAILCMAACNPISKGAKVRLPAAAYPVQRGIVTDEDLANHADRLVLDYLEEAQVPGLSISLVRDGQVVFSAGYGWSELESERAFTADTLVLLSSVSKTFVGTAAMQAVERGTLALDDAASERLPFRLDNPKVDGDTITLRHLLTHNSGIEDSWAYGFAYADGDPEISLTDFSRGYLIQGGDHWRSGNFANRMPGDAFAYSNVGMSVAALAIGASEGLEFSALLDRDVLDPLGMTASAYLLADLPEEPAVPYDRAGNGFRPFAQYGYPTYPDGMLRSTANEMGRYLAAIEAGGAIDGVRILAPGSVDALLTVDPAYGTDESGQAIAWSMRKARGRELFGHNGGDFGSSTEIWIDREAGTGIVILLNANPPAFRPWFDLELDLLDALD